MNGKGRKPFKTEPLESADSSLSILFKTRQQTQSTPKTKINSMIFGVITVYLASINNSCKWITYFYAKQYSGRYQTWPVLSGQASVSVIKLKTQKLSCCPFFNIYFGRSSTNTSKFELSSCLPLLNSYELGNGESELFLGERVQDLHLPISVLLFTSLWN